MKHTIKELLKQITLKLIIAAVSFVVALYIFAFIIHYIFFENEDKLDQVAFHYLSKNASEHFIDVMHFFTIFGKPDFLLPAYVMMVAWLFIRKKNKLATEVAILGATSTGLLFGLKYLFQRHRPKLQIMEHLSGYSFPSGHALLSFAFCSVLIYFIWQGGLPRYWKWILSVLLILFSFFVGISRIVLRVHYATDVIAGFCLGYIWVLFFFWVIRRRIQKVV